MSIFGQLRQLQHLADSTMSTMLSILSIFYGNIADLTSNFDKGVGILSLSDPVRLPLIILQI